MPRSHQPSCSSLFHLYYRSCWSQRITWLHNCVTTFAATMFHDIMWKSIPGSPPLFSFFFVRARVSLRTRLPIAATSFTGQHDMVPVEVPINTLFKSIPKCRHLAILSSGQMYSVQLVPGLYEIHSITRTLACLSHKIVQHCWLIHQVDIILTLMCIVQASGYPFSPLYSKAIL